MTRSVLPISSPSGRWVYTVGYHARSKPRASRCSSSQRATSLCVVTPGVMTSFDSARSSKRRVMSPIFENSMISEATRSPWKSAMRC